MRADDDAPPYRQIRNRVLGDLHFLRRLALLRRARKLADLTALADAVTAEIVAAAERGKSGPRWRAIAVERAIDAVLRERERST